MTLSAVTLRFRDPDLERAFQLEAGARYRGQVLATIILGAATWAATGLLLPLVFPVDPVAVIVAIGAVEVVILGLLVALRRGRTWDEMQLLSGLVNLVGGLAIVVIGGFIADVPQVLAAALLVNMLFAFGLSRLSFMVAVGVTAPYLAVFTVLVLADRLPGLGAFEIFLVLVGFGVSTIGGYLLEASSRRLFWQRGIISSQAEQIAREKDVAGAARREHAARAHRATAARTTHVGGRSAARCIRPVRRPGRLHSAQRAPHPGCRRRSPR